MNNIAERCCPSCVLITLLAVFAMDAAAQEYPVKPVRMFVGFVPGSGTDTAARLLALGEMALTLIVICTLGWDARNYRRKPR